MWEGRAPHTSNSDMPTSFESLLPEVRGISSGDEDLGVRIALRRMAHNWNKGNHWGSTFTLLSTTLAVAYRRGPFLDMIQVRKSVEVT